VHEQHQGIEQVDQAVSKENAAWASSLHEHAGQLVQQVSAFRMA
jgi:hypothetical protein